MLNPDYIMRTIEQAMRAVTMARQSREHNDVHQAVEFLGSASRNIVGLGLEDVLHMPVESLLLLLGDSANIDASKVLAMTQILSEKGIIHEMHGDTVSATLCYRRALALYRACETLAPRAPELAESRAFRQDLEQRFNAVMCRNV